MKQWLKDWAEIWRMVWLSWIHKCDHCGAKTIDIYYDKAKKYWDKTICTKCGRSQ